MLPSKTASAWSKPGAGRFPQISGMVIGIDVTRPVGSRVLSVSVGGTAARPMPRTYILATNEFMARGGDGYAMFKDAKQLIDPIAATLLATQVIDYIAAKGSIAPKVDGRIVTK